MSVNQSTEDGEVKLFQATDATQEVKEFEKGGSYLFRLKNQNHRFLFNAFRSVDNSLGITPSFSNGAGSDYIQAGYLGDYKYSKNLNASSQMELGVTFDWAERDFDGSSGENFKAEGYRYRVYARTAGNFNERSGYRLEADYQGITRLSYVYQPMVNPYSLPTQPTVYPLRNINAGRKVEGVPTFVPGLDTIKRQLTGGE